jgi:PAS domain S-box-containing protein
MFEDSQGLVKSPSLARQNILLWFTFLVIILVSSLAFFSIRQLTAASAQVQRSETLLIEISHFLFDLKDVETGGRGYALSDGDIRHWQRQENGIVATNADSVRLRQLARRTELQQPLERLFQLAALRIASSRKLVAERHDAAKTRRNLVDGMVLMDRIRDQVSVVFADQQRQHQQEQQRLERQAWETSLVLAAGVAICLAMFAWLFALRGREVEQRRQLEEELRALNLELEDRVQERTAEVKRARDLLDAVVENLPDMILLKEPIGDSFRYLLVNAAGERLLGRDRSEIIGKTERELFPAEEAGAVIDGNQAVLGAGQPRTFTDRKLTTPSGVRAVETRMVPITNGGGAANFILAIIRDVTDAKAREDQLRQLQRMDAIGRLTGGVAHDFNNLLAIIQGNSELIQNQLEKGSEAAEMAEDVIGAADRGAELVRRLLAFARMQHLEPEAVDLNVRLTNILGMLQRSLGETVHVRVNAATGLWPATVDPTQVDDALVNLAINARDAMPKGGTLTIETQNVALDEDYAAHHVEVVPGDYVMLAVSDTGTGMSPEVIARAFEPFFTTKHEGQGTGLGLSQVFGWVKQSGGHIKIYSEVGYGTTLKLYLPRAAALSAEKPAAPELSTPSGDETILVVEDNPNVRKTVLRQLHDLGYHAIEADSGTAALELVRGGAKFDLLLTDVIMPGGITGYQLAEELRETRPELKVLFTSGYTELAVSTEQCARRDALLSKPYRKQDLGRAVRAALDQVRVAETTSA